MAKKKDEKNRCAVKYTAGDKRVDEDMVREWMRAQNEAGRRYAARGDRRHSADRLET